MNEFILAFLLGGSILAFTKYLATVLHRPDLGAIITSIPLGLIAVYFLSAERTLVYSRHYLENTFYIILSIICFLLLYVHTGISRDVSVTLSLLVWVILIMIREFSKYKN